MTTAGGRHLVRAPVMLSEEGPPGGTHPGFLGEKGDRQHQSLVEKTQRKPG